jgi:hypothetical protein
MISRCEVRFKKVNGCASVLGLLRWRQKQEGDWPPICIYSVSRPHAEWKKSIWPGDAGRVLFEWWKEVEIRLTVLYVKVPMCSVTWHRRQRFSLAIKAELFDQVIQPSLHGTYSQFNPVFRSQGSFEASSAWELDNAASINIPSILQNPDKAMEESLLNSSKSTPGLWSPRAFETLLQCSGGNYIYAWPIWV